jgi:hypothetical protein
MVTGSLAPSRVPSRLSAISVLLGPRSEIRYLTVLGLVVGLEYEKTESCVCCEKSRSQSFVVIKNGLGERRFVWARIGMAECVYAVGWGVFFGQGRVSNRLVVGSACLGRVARCTQVRTDPFLLLRAWFWCMYTIGGKSLGQCV